MPKPLTPKNNQSIYKVHTHNTMNRMMAESTNLVRPITTSVNLIYKPYSDKSRIKKKVKTTLSEISKPVNKHNFRISLLKVSISFPIIYLTSIISSSCIIHKKIKIHKKNCFTFFPKQMSAAAPQNWISCLLLVLCLLSMSMLTFLSVFSTHPVSLSENSLYSPSIRGVPSSFTGYTSLHKYFCTGSSNPCIVITTI